MNAGSSVVKSPSQYDRVVITARSVIEAIASAQPYRSRSAKLDKLYENRPRIFDDFVRFEVCHGGLPMQSIPCVEIKSVAQLNEEATNSLFPNRAKWRMTSICGCGWSCRVFRFSMPQVIPAGLVPRWHRHNEDRHIGSNERQPFYRLKRLAQVPSSCARDTNSIYLLPLYCLSCSAFHLDIG
jgi:hypothetical protein